LDLAHLLASLGVLIFLATMLWAAVSDLVSFRIPNAVPIIAAAAFPLTTLALGWELRTLMLHLGAGATMLALCFVLFIRGYIGGGDAKLLAAASLWTGWAMMPAHIFAVTVLGGLFALLVLVFRRLPLPDAFAAISWVARLHGEPAHIPYGVAIAGGTLIVLRRLPEVTPLVGS